MRRPARVLAYCRVSGREQGASGTSLDAQRDRWIAWCAERAFPAPIFFVEIESGSEERRDKRVELQRLLDEAQPGDLAGVTLVTRWGRDAADALVDARTLRRRGIPWIAIDEEPTELLIEPGDDRGIGLLEQRAAGAAEERRSIKRRTVGARRRIRDAGGWAEGPAPFGYCRPAGKPKAERHYLEIVEPDAALVRQAFERCAGGASLRELAEWWGVERGIDTDKVVLWRLLRHRVYLGEVRSSGGAWIRARWPAIVDLDLWTRARAALGERQRGGARHSSPRTASWLLRGLASCPECGSRMGAAYSGGSKAGAPCCYYVCGQRLRGGCSSPYARQPDTDARAEQLVVARLVELREDLARPVEAPRVDVPDFARRRAQLDAQLARAEDGYVRGALREEAVARARERVQDELGRLAVAEGAVARATLAADPQTRRRLLGQVGAVEAAWGAAPVEARRAVLSLLARRILVCPDRVEVEWRTAEELRMESVSPNLFGAPDAEPTGEPLPVTPQPRRGRR